MLIFTNLFLFCCPIKRMCLKILVQIRLNRLVHIGYHRDEVFVHCISEPLFVSFGWNDCRFFICNLLHDWLCSLVESILLYVVDNANANRHLLRIDDHEKGIVNDRVLCEVQRIVCDRNLEHSFHLMLHWNWSWFHVSEEVIVQGDLLVFRLWNVPISARTLQIVLQTNWLINVEKEIFH